MSEFRSIAIGGYPGSGKTVLAERLADHGFQVFTGSTILRKEAEKTGFESDGSRDGYIEYWSRVSEERGRNWLALSAIEMADGKPFVYDGLRVKEDAETLQGHDVLIAFIEFDPVEALRKINARKRGDDEGILSLSGLLNRLEVEDNDDPFSQHYIRDISGVLLPAIPFIENPDIRKARIDLSARVLVVMARN